MPVPNPFDLMLRTLEMRSRLTEDDRAAIRQLPVKLRTFEPSSYLLREGEHPESCAMIISGFVYRQKLTAEGARQIVALHLPGELLDFQNLYLDTADHNVQTLTRAEVALFARDDVQALIEARPQVARAVWLNVLVDGSILREWVLNVGRRNSRAALAHLLCEFAIRLDTYGLTEHYGYELPMTQEQLGDALGLTSVHVNRTMKALEAQGLVVRSNRRVRFPNWKALRDVGDFNARYLHLEQQVS